MRHLNRRILALLTAAALALTLPGCSTAQDTTDTAAELATEILLSDDGITVNGQTASDDSSSAVYVGADIVYYESGHDETYGEGTEADAHSADEAARHTVVTITEPVSYTHLDVYKRQLLHEDAAEQHHAPPWLCLLQQLLFILGAQLDVLCDII